MKLFKRGRYLYRLMAELSRKYRAALLLGFLLGLLGSIVFLKISPVVDREFLTPTEHIGMVGDFTPTTLPYDIQSKLSFGLTRIAADGSASAALAGSWEATASGKVYLFHLKKNVFWPSGMEVTARDVNYNIRDVTFRALSDRTLEARLSESYSPFPTLVSKPIFRSGLVGFGAYRVDSIRLEGDRISYLRILPAPGTHGPSAEYRFYPTESMAIVAYKRGDVDILQDLTSPADLTGWKNTAVTVKTDYQEIVSLFYNTKNPKLTEKSLRQALSYDIPDIAAERAWSPISVKSWAYEDPGKHYTYEPDTAKPLFAKSALASASASLTISTFAPYIDLAQSIANNWTALGIPTGVRVINDLSDGFEVLLTAQFIPPDPDQYPFWHSTQKETNITGYTNVKIDKLLEDGRVSTNVSTRKAIYADFARRLVDDDPVTFLYYPKRYTITRVHR
ncbi:ABC transporter substrate-binding protein [Patescibacteria group bacterium]|nr:ABC transporter substrate-binding protein [Patescibacteria group bacterium]